MSQADPGVFSNAVNELLDEVNRAQTQMQRLDSTSTKGPNENFSQVMQSQQANQVGQAAQPGQSKAADSSHVLWQAKKNVMSTKVTSVGSTERKERSMLANMIQRIIDGQDQMTEVMNKAMSGRQFGPVDLIKMQVSVYHYTQELDLSTKVIDKASNSVKQTMNTQV